jgi:hypothetical protein
MSKAITISLDVLNALSPQKGMLNASVKELEKQTFTFHSIVAPTDRVADLMAVSEDNSYVKARYVNPKTKKSFLIPIRGLLNLGLVQMGTTNVKAVPAATVISKVNDWLLEKATEGKGVNLPESFYVVSVKDRVQEGTGNIMYPAYCYQEFSDKIEELRATDPKADLGPIYQNYDFMQGLYAGKRSERYATAEATKDIVISV